MMWPSPEGDALIFSNRMSIMMLDEGEIYSEQPYIYIFLSKVDILKIQLISAC